MLTALTFPGQIKTLFPSANISGSGSDYLLDALDPLFTKLSDAYMEDLIETFGTGEKAFEEVAVVCCVCVCACACVCACVRV